MSTLTNVLEAPLIDLIVGGIIKANTGGVAAKIYGRASELLAINNALIQINGGNTAGVAALQSAIAGTSNLDPSEALALQNLSGQLSSLIAAAVKVEGSTLLGQAQAAVFNSILTIANNTAQAYITQYAPAPAPATA